MFNQNKFFTIAVFTLCLNLLAFSQTTENFSIKSYKTQNTGMYILGSWAILNMATGAYGWNQYTGDKKYFSQMNFLWNTVNLSIAGFALHKNLHVGFQSFDSIQLLENHIKTERLFLINAGLDLIYMGSGFLLKNYSAKSSKNSNLLLGYGNALLLQGGFLLAFDMLWYFLLHKQRMLFLNQSPISFALAPNGFQLFYNF